MKHQNDGVAGQRPVQEQCNAKTKKPSTKTTPDLFIIESLAFSDEAEKRAEGDFLAHVLTQSRNHQYFYFRTVAELEVLAQEFGKSRYRYLHLSCHANNRGISTTLEKLTYRELGELLGPYLRGRRVFFSACGAANKECADALMRNTGCLSVMGPSEDIRFDDSAIAWASFYHRIFRMPGDDVAGRIETIRRQDIIEAAEKMAKYFAVPFRFYYRDDGNIEEREFSAA
ncbi:hypothetical protein [Burkholderia sp. LMG 32019]|uniref:hypothetical protein n=1 Tax=Burkholderia sp. LMG 32019 TaxID=3158173 RepID=UPI003C2C46F4